MKIKKYFKTFFLLLVCLFQFLQAIGIEQLELKSPPWKEQKTILKGNVREDISKAKPLTGIGVIGLRFIHQTGYPSFIEQVYPNSPAKRGGIHPQDLIFAIDGMRTDQLSSDGVYHLLSGSPGTKVKVFITRGKTMFNVELIREDLANFDPEVQNRYLSGPIAVPINLDNFPPHH